MPEQFKGSNDCGIWVCNAIGAYLTQVVIRQRLLENVKDRYISTDVGIIRGDFSGAEFDSLLKCGKLKTTHSCGKTRKFKHFAMLKYIRIDEHYLGG